SSVAVDCHSRASRSTSPGVRSWRDSRFCLRDATARHELQGFATYHEEDIIIGAGATIERTAVLKLAGLAESVVVEGAGSRIDARNPGFGTSFGEDLKTIPARRSSMFDAIRAAPGISPTSPSSGTTFTVSAVRLRYQRE